MTANCQGYSQEGTAKQTEDNSTQKTFVHIVKYLDDLHLISEDKSQFPTQEDIDLNQTKKC